MSKRLQVVMDAAEYRELLKVSRRNGMTISQWVRHALARMGRNEPIQDVRPKLNAVREALKHSYPTADIDQMLEETERGYTSGTE